MDKLPAPLNQFEVGKTKIDDVTKLLRTADLIEDNKHYFIFQEFKYALELIYKDDILQSLNFTFPKEGPSIEIIKREIEQSKLKMHPETGPSAGKFFKIEHAKGKVIFNPQTKTIYSVELK